MVRTRLNQRLSSPLGVILAVVLLGTTSHHAPSQGSSASAKPSPEERAERLNRSAELKAQAEEQMADNKLGEAVATVSKALALDRELFGEKSAQVADTLTLLGQVHERREDWAAATRAREEVLAIRLKAGGAKHWKTADARRGVEYTATLRRLEAAQRKALRGADDSAAQVARLDQQRKFKDAFDLARKNVKERQAILGENHWQVADALHQLGRLYLGSEEWASARKANEKALAIRQRILGEIHPNTGRSWYNLGNALIELKEPERAIRAYQRAVSIWHATVGDEDELTDLGLSRVGDVLKSQSDFAGAKQTYTKLLDIRRKTLGAAHPLTAWVLSQVGTLEMDLRDFPAARRHCEEALAIYRKSLPIDNSALADTLVRLGYVLSIQKDLQGARARYEEALPLLRKDPADQANLDLCLRALALIYVRQQEPERERKCREELVALRRNVQGNDHLLTANSLANLAIALHKQGEYAAARKYFEEGLAIYRKKDDAKRLRVARTLNALGLTLRKLKAYGEARRCHEEALAIHRKSRGNQDPNTATSLSYLGETLDLLKEPAAAKACHEEALAIRQALDARAKPAQNEVYRARGMALRKRGDMKGAIAAALKTVEIEQALPKAEPKLAASLLWLGGMYEEDGDFDAARATREKSLAIHRKVYGPNAWQTVDALLELKGTDDNAKLSAEQRSRLRQADDLEQLANGPAKNLSGANSAAKGRTPLSVLREVIAIRAQLLGEYHPVTAATMHRAAIRAAKQQDWAESRKLNEKALAIRRRTLTEDHPEVARSLTNLGIAMRRLGEPRRAEEAHSQALTIARRTLAEGDDLIYVILFQLAEDYRRLGEDDDARKAIKQIFDVARRRAGPDAFFTVWTGLKMAEVYRRTGKAAEVRELVAGWLDKPRKSTNSEEETLQTLATPKAHFLLTQADHAWAQGLLDEETVQKFRQSTNSRGNALRSVAAATQARILHTLGEHAEAQGLLDEAILRRPRFLSWSDADCPLRAQDLYHALLDGGGKPVVGAATLIGIIHLALESYAEAEETFERVLQSVHEGSLEEAVALHGLGAARLRLRKTDAALPLLERAVKVYGLHLPANGLALAHCLCEMGESQRRKGKFLAAAQAYAEATRHLRRGGKAETASAASALLAQAKVREELREFVEARAAVVEGLAITRKLFTDHCRRMNESKDYCYRGVTYDVGHVLGQVTSSTTGLIPRHVEQMFETACRLVPRDHPGAESVFRGFASLTILGPPGYKERTEIEFQMAARLRPSSPPSAPTFAPAKTNRSSPVAENAAYLRLNTEARRLDRAGRLAEAVAAHEKAFAEATKIYGEGSGSARSHLESIARLEKKRGRFAAAITALEKEISMLEKNKNSRASISYKLQMLGELEEECGNWKAAAMRFREAIKREMAANVNAFYIQNLEGMAAHADHTAKLTPGQRQRALEADRLFARAEFQEGDDPGEKPLAFQKVLAIRDEIYGPTYRKTVEVLVELLKAQTQAGEPAKALKIAEGHLPSLAKAPPSAEIAAAFFVAGKAALVAGQEAIGLQYLHQAATISLKAQPVATRPAIDSLNMLADRAMHRDDAAEARKHYEAALTILPNAGAERNMVEGRLGWALVMLGELDLGEKVLHSALTQTDTSNILSSKMPDDVRSGLWMALGIIAQTRGDLATARLHIDEAERLMNKAVGKRTHSPLKGSPERGSAFLHFMRGMLISEMGDQRTAEREVQTALAHFQKVLPGDDPFLALARADLGIIQTRGGRFKDAKASLDAAFDQITRVRPKDHVEVAEIKLSRGVLFLATADPAAAVHSLAQALQTFLKVYPKPNAMKATCMVQLALALIDVGNLNDARKLLKAAQKDYQQLGVAGPVLGQTHLISGLLAMKEGEAQTAATLFGESVDAIVQQAGQVAALQSEREQLLLLQSHRRHLDLFLSTASDREGLEAQYRRLLGWKGSVTRLQGQQRADRDASDADVRALLKELGEVTRSLTTASRAGLAPSVPSPIGGTRSVGARSFKYLDAQRQKLERKLLEVSSAARKRRAEAAYTAKEIRDALPDDAALVDFLQYTRIICPDKTNLLWRRETHLVAYVLRKQADTVVRLDLGPSRRVGTLVAQWRASHGAGRIPAGADPSAALRDLVWKPLEPHLRDVKLVLISPDGPLNDLPFPALPGSAAGKFLLEDRTIVTLPVPRGLPDLARALPRDREVAPSLLVVGDIDFDARISSAEDVNPAGLPARSVFKALSGTRREMEEIERTFGKAFPKAQKMLLSKAGATKDSFAGEVSRYRYVHLATHGFFADESVTSATVAQTDTRSGGTTSFLDPSPGDRLPGLLSGLAFAGVNRTGLTSGEHSILTALEAGDLDLHRTELVVLSACDTGRGRVAGGEGVLGLQRSFQVAGAKTVVASLWSVDDSATRALMTEFYRNLWEKKLPKAEALRQAQLEMIHHYRFDAASRQVVDLRGGGVRIDDPEARRKLEEQLARLKKTGTPLPPFYWAAFVLSGDWR